MKINPWGNANGEKENGKFKDPAYNPDYVPLAMVQNALHDSHELHKHKGYTVCVLRDKTDGDWGYNFKKGSFNSLQGYTMHVTQDCGSKGFWDTKEETLLQAQQAIDKL